jgi:ABC-2 type transport system permease protein
MRHVPTLLRRELGAYFLGPMAFLIMLAFQVIACLNFWQLVNALSMPQQSLSTLNDPMNAYISYSTPFWFLLVFALPALTMRLVAEERRSGTIETLLTVPVTETEIVIAKWLSGLVMYLLLLLPFALYLPFLYYQAKFHYDVGPLISLGIGLTTMGMMFVAIGLFFSALTRNQIVAAIWTFVAMFLILMLPLLVYVVAEDRRASWLEAARFVTLLIQVQSFGAGQLDLRFVTLHLSVCMLMLYLTVKILEFRRER